MRTAAIISIVILLVLGAATAGYQWEQRNNASKHCQLVTTKDTNQYSPTYGDSFSKWVCKTY